MARAKSAPLSSRTRTASRSPKSPLTPAAWTPTAKRDEPIRMARVAPASSAMVPRTGSAMIHCLRPETVRTAGSTVVPMSRDPPSSSAMCWGCCAERMTVVTPAAEASCAALSFVAMPPVPHCVPDPPPPAAASTFLSASTTLCTSRIGAAGGLPGSGVALGLDVYSASTSVARNRCVAPTRMATRAESESLSPNRSSETATESFSLTTGMTPMRSSSWKVAVALSTPSLESSASALSNTWAMGWPSAEKSSS
mmetsp:Transcript_15358/g.30835  ORF Transcript_15358/g.30835 Transcript_15358/m.30835 type:complete len:253 (+) Transcript_15358:575-1333(+)